MSEVNRSILVVKPRQPYLDWALALPDPTPVTLEHLRANCNAYLVPEILDPGDELAILQDHHAFIFEHELAGWMTDQDLWPQERDLQIFTEWFDTEFHSMVFELCEEAVLPWRADDG